MCRHQRPQSHTLAGRSPHDVPGASPQLCDPLHYTTPTAHTYLTYTQPLDSSTRIPPPTVSELHSHRRREREREREREMWAGEGGGEGEREREVGRGGRGCEGEMERELYPFFTVFADRKDASRNPDPILLKLERNRLLLEIDLGVSFN